MARRGARSPVLGVGGCGGFFRVERGRLMMDFDFR